MAFDHRQTVTDTATHLPKRPNAQSNKIDIMVVDLKNPGRTIHVGVILTGGFVHLSFNC